MNTKQEPIIVKSNGYPPKKLSSIMVVDQPFRYARQLDIDEIETIREMFAKYLHFEPVSEEHRRYNKTPKIPYMYDDYATIYMSVASTAPPIPTFLLSGDCGRISVLFNKKMLEICPQIENEFLSIKGLLSQKEDLYSLQNMVHPFVIVYEEKDRISLRNILDRDANVIDTLLMECEGAKLREDTKMREVQN